MLDDIFPEVVNVVSAVIIEELISSAIESYTVKLHSAVTLL